MFFPSPDVPQTPLLATRHHLSYDICLVDNGDNYQYLTVVCCVVYCSVVHSHY